MSEALAFQLPDEDSEDPSISLTTIKLTTLLKTMCFHMGTAKVMKLSLRLDLVTWLSWL